jgi:hypothetical protein
MENAKRIHSARSQSGRDDVLDVVDLIGGPVRSLRLGECCLILNVPLFGEQLSDIGQKLI